VDTRAVLQDQLAGVTKSGETDLALLTDGLAAEREQGITIDVAYRYFATESRKFIIGDAPGHEQYTRNMVTAASSADAAVVLVDATKLDWKNADLELLPQTRRHSLLAHLLRVNSLVFAVNKLDAVEDPALAFAHISAALQKFTASADIKITATVPVSALKGYNVVNSTDGWAGYHGPSLLQLLEQLPNTPTDSDLALAFPCSGWRSSLLRPTPARAAVFWGRVATGVARVGAQVQILPSGQLATVAQVIDHARAPKEVAAGLSAGITLDREVDVSRGDWIIAAPCKPKWPRMTLMPLLPQALAQQPRDHRHRGLDGHRTPGARSRLLGAAWPSLGQGQGAPLGAPPQYQYTGQGRRPAARGQCHRPGGAGAAGSHSGRPLHQARQLGSLILVDTASNATAGAALVN
jgi:sulfate adenylyltransferase subunit 1